MERYTSQRCGDCGRGLTWIEIAFGRHGDPVCGRCLRYRAQPLQVLRVEPCANDRDGAWCRVWTVRDGESYISEMSWPLARRIVPRLLARYGVECLPAGFWHGAPAVLS